MKPSDKEGDGMAMKLSERMRLGDEMFPEDYADNVSQLEAENEVLRKYADHKGYCRARLRQLGDVCVCGYTDALKQLESE